MKINKFINNAIQHTAREYFEKVASGEIKLDEVYTNVTDEQVDKFLKCLNVDINEIKIHRDESD